MADVGKFKIRSTIIDNMDQIFEVVAGKSGAIDENYNFTTRKLTLTFDPIMVR